MGEQNKKELKDELHMRVTKSNSLIQKGQYKLSLQEQKIILYVISKIGQYDKELKELEFNIPDFCRLIGIDESQGKNYRNLRETIKGLCDKSFYYPTYDGTGLTLMRWVEKPFFNFKPGTTVIEGGTFRLKLDKDMLPYLINMKEKFTSYELIWTIGFKHKYSIRLYELLSSYHYDKFHPYETTFGFDELRTMLGLKIRVYEKGEEKDIDKYPKYQNFKDKVLDPAVEEINKASNKTISYTPIKTGKKVTSIKIKIESKGAIESMKLEENIEKNLVYL